MTSHRGKLAIVLHSHMPYVEGHGVWPFGEQWLWEVVASSYLRVADVVRGKPVTVGVTPVLADQFEAMRGPAGDRFIAWVNDSREYVYGEDMAAFLTVERPELHAALAPQLTDYRVAISRFENEFDRDLNGMFDALGASGVELIGGPATHPILPLLASDFGLDLQLATGRRSHAERFGAARGIWLPECAWDRGLDAALVRNAVEYFCVDQSAWLGEQSLDNLEPISTPAGPVAMPIDWHTVAQVWREDGYPSTPVYRSTFARTIHDLLPYNNAGDGWLPEAARNQARAHAENFLRSLAARLEVYAAERGRAGTSVFAADTELFGHWWYEGPWWLEHVLKMAPEYGIELVTLGTAAAEPAPVAREIQRSSWGVNKTLETWDSPKTSAMVWNQRRAELQLEQVLAGPVSDQEAATRARAELLALQTSDWTYMESIGRTGEYGARRFAEHLAAFERALSKLRG
ncbi:MAG: 1,4-alpha-glucan branching protein domain-containing protein [Solirubrobacterales bacterium]